MQRPGWCPAPAPGTGITPALNAPITQVPLPERSNGRARAITVSRLATRPIGAVPAWRGYASDAERLVAVLFPDGLLAKRLGIAALAALISGRGVWIFAAEHGYPPELRSSG